MDASVAKYLTTETACEIADKALQLHGGYGYVREYPIERIFRDARFHRLGERTTQIQQVIISRELFKCYRCPGQQ
jgi:alkylation response protein AidB-like acyl-CoA dehydrogenase